jgi:hypothetical protein
MDFMRDTFGSAWAYYVAFGILIAWFVIYQGNKRK